MSVSRWPWITALIATLTLIADGIPELAAAWTYQSGADVQQLLGCHLAHWSGEHLLWDLTVFIVLGAVCERLSRRRMAAALLLSAVLIPPLVMLVMPQVQAYRGLSGLDTALFALLSSQLLGQGRQTRNTSLVAFGGISLAGVLIKSVLELHLNHALFVGQSAADFAVTPMGHLVGGLIGAMVGCSSPLRKEATCVASSSSSLSAS